MSLVPAQAAPPPLKLLFLGDNGHHRPAERYRQLAPVMAERGIEILYSDNADSLNSQTLARYDGLIVFANIDDISPGQESALLDFVGKGKGFIPLHCASYCFRNSSKYVELVGAQFQRHETGVFRVTNAQPNHPIMKGFESFASWDETYVHTKHNEKDRIVLEYRDETGRREPWTWVRTHGRGRVFYTAWGHDHRTWSHAGFHNLVERGIRWACGQDPATVARYTDRPAMTAIPKDIAPFEYVPAKIPFYPASKKWGTMAEPISKMQKPLPPDESMKHFVTPVGFEVRRFVDESKLGGKPICMAWDEQGRLWVAITYDYPNELQPKGMGRDRIVVCKDIDGDGQCDTVTVFADKLSIPTSILPSHGGIIVHQAPDTLFLKDTDGDGKADLRQVLFTGWGTGDTHAGPSNMRYGFDNWVYGIVGYSAFQGTVAGERVSFRQGLYRFKVERAGDDPHQLKVSKLEFLRSTSNNSWGVGISEDGLLFGSTANGCVSVFLPIPNRYYEKVSGMSASVLAPIILDNHFEPITEKVRQVDWHHGFTAAAGHALYTARTYPPEYWNRTAFVCEPTGHLASALVLQPNGADFVARYGWNILASDDEWSAPIMAEVGPDGHVWVIDWYNFIVQHNPTPPGFRTGKGNAYEIDLRDKKHGRVYRVVYTGAPAEKPFSLKDASPAKLVETLKHPNMTWRLHAQRLLVERGQRDVVERLIAMVTESKQDAAGVNPGAIHALETLHGLGVLDGTNRAATMAALQATRQPGAQRIALQVVPRRPDVFAAIDQNLIEHRDPQVRLALLLALAELPADTVGGVNCHCALLDERNVADPVLLDALTIAAAVHDVAFLKRIAQVNLPLTPNRQRVVETVARHMARRGAGDAVADLLEALNKVTAPGIVAPILNGLASWRSASSVKLTAGAEKAVAELLAKLPASDRVPLLKLARAWGVKGLDASIAELAKSLLAATLSDTTGDTARVEAAKQYVEMAELSAQTIDQILGSITPRSSPQLTSGLLEAVASKPSLVVGPEIVKRLSTWPPSARAAAIRTLLSRVDATRALVDALDKGQVPFGDLSLDQRQALAAHSDATISAKAKAILARGGGLPDPDRQKVIEQLKSLAIRSGDAALGKAVFKNHCAKCHRHSGEGELIGPDLTGMAVHPKEHLLNEILDPSRNVEGNFRIYRVEMKDGRTFNGLLASETRNTIELIDAEAKRHPLQRADIEELVASNKSLMPEGFEKTLKPDELTNLLEFLTQKGKYLPIPLDKVATVVSTKGMFFAEESEIERMIFPDWKPKTFEGVPFVLVDPQGDKVPNVVLLHGPNGRTPPKMPKSVSVPLNAPATVIHLLSGVSGWGYPSSRNKSVSMIVRLHYAGGASEDHPLRNAVHFADYISRQEVPESKFAFALRGQQIRYLAIEPKRRDVIERIEFVKGQDASSPIIMAVTAELAK
jgi:hypothetical protein